MRKILFVDDEPSLLDGLRRMLRPLRHEWQVEFASSGQKALETLATASFDVLVTDMRMPAMDGAQLLQEVRNSYPQIVRIVLSGQCDEETVLRSVGAAHQYLAKPCDAESLKATVNRACALRDLLANDKLKGMLSRMQSLPSLPALYLEVKRELQSPDPSIQTVGQIIAQDMGMAAKILQMVNSAFFGLPCRVSSIIQAVSLLGLETTRALVLSAHVFSQFEHTRVKNLSIEALWAHSLATGALAQQVAKAERSEHWVLELYRTAGLLHDTGKLVLASCLPDDYGAVIEMAQVGNVAICEAERETFGSTHAEIGAYLLGLWGLPDAIVEAVAWHHRPNDCPAGTFGLLTAVHVANALTHQRPGCDGQSAVALVDTDYLDRLGLTARLPIWQNLLQDVNPS
jgi:putative nucleotidyltransferase with HDIG domain